MRASGGRETVSISGRGVKRELGAFAGGFGLACNERNEIRWSRSGLPGSKSSWVYVSWIASQRFPYRPTRKGKIMIFKTIALFSALIIASTASAQDWAKAKLAASPRHQDWVDVKYGNRS